MAESSEPTFEAPLATGLARVGWFVGGLLCAAIGIVGVVVPGLPTTGPMILAASCFAKSSRRFEQRVLDLPGVGPMVRDYRDGLGMPKRAKLMAIAMIAGVSMLSALVLVPSVIASIVILVVAAIGVWFVATRVPTRERVLAERFC